MRTLVKNNSPTAKSHTTTKGVGKKVNRPFPMTVLKLIMKPVVEVIRNKYVLHAYEAMEGLGYKGLAMCREQHAYRQ